MMYDAISMFIDNEFNLNEKIEFVNELYGNQALRDKTIDFLEQEKVLRSDVVDQIPRVKFSQRRRISIPIWRPITLLTSAAAVTLFLFFLSFPADITTHTPYRFIIFHPDASQAEITGSFSQWKRLPMQKTGTGGYWEITLDIPKGEHRFIYILDGKQRFSDPTLPGREKDDFGGENSILSV